MPIHLPSGLLRRLPITLLLLTAAPAVLAQVPYGVTVQALPQSNDPAELLAQALRTLATESANLAALTAAGRNALILGDPNAAVGFFGRAQEIAPSNGAVKAGLGSALVQLEKPQDALRLFAQAARFGVPDADMAEDRGLAYDLTGQQSLAQRDYQIVLAAHPDDETARRRLALSQGISGNKAAAIATLDPLIRKRDIAGWRAQTFVLAMDGDPQGASAITRIMLPQQSAMLQPFLVRLAGLSPADKARAVHFGEMPASGTPYTPTQVASVDTPATYAAAPPPRPYVAPTPLPVTRAPVPAPTVIPSAQPAPAPQKPVQVASAVPQPRVQRRPPGVEVNDRDAIFALGQPYYVRAPLAQIALTPTQPVTVQPKPGVATPPAATLPPTGGSSATISALPPPSTVPASASSPPPSQAPAPQPIPAPMHIAQSSPPPTDLAAPPAPPPELPTPAAEGHYDLPHDAVAKAQPTKPAPPVRVIGTPVVHATLAAPTAARADDTPATEARTREARTPPPAPTKLADADAPPVKTRTTKAAAAEADVSAAKPPKKAAIDDDGCAPVATSKGKRRSKAGKASATCTSLATDDANADSTAKSRKSLAADDCAPAAKSRGRTKAKVSTRCTRLAAADDDGDAGSTKGSTARARKASADATGSKFAGSSRSRPTDKVSAERIYVQVAGGANKEDMDKAWAGVKKKAPDLMNGRTPATTPLKATNRLLVGPFKNDDEAQSFVNKMAAKGLSGFTFKSSKGQKVDKVDSDQ